ncbi:hypothetical protein VD0002_g5200 [Verticillium dahliae]|nr:hypothetical protein VD0002_g5200 [Verticillium dahliae]PNH74644.1 hypothetical protein VD0001_g2928 [Verticillium dahliae]
MRDCTITASSIDTNVGSMTITWRDPSTFSSMDQSMDHLSAAVETTAATGHSTSMVAWHDSRTDDIRTQRWRSGQDGSVLVRRALLTGMRMMVFPIMATS